MRPNLIVIILKIAYSIMPGDWQSTGLGTAMSAGIEKKLRDSGINKIILLGGVQASNLKAVNFYKKEGIRFLLHSGMMRRIITI